MTTDPPAPFTCLVLAGDRGPGDPLLDHTGAPGKALVKIDGIAMINRVIGTLGRAETAGAIWLSGPAESALPFDTVLKAAIARGEVTWRAPGPTPSTSACELMAEIGEAPVLLTTADHPLLCAGMVDEFCRRSGESGADVTVGLAPYPLVRERFPAMKKTVLSFRDGDFCGCNLFSFLSPRGRRAADFWKTLEGQRKRPLKLIAMLGWYSLLRYKLGKLSLDEALTLVSKKLGLEVRAVILDHGEAAVDVDSVDDYLLVADFLKNQK